jgi:hypothetical protein
VCQQALGHSSLKMTRRHCQALDFDDVFKTHKKASPVDNAMKECGWRHYGLSRTVVAPRLLHLGRLV